MHRDLQTLIQLQELDSTAERLRRRIADLPAVEGALDERAASLTGTVAAIKDRLTTSQASRREIEKDLAVVQGRLSKYKEQLMEVKTNKEYHAMQSEIATAEERVRHEEDRLLERMEEAETLAAELKAAEAALKSGEAEIATERQQLHAQRGVDEQELARIVGERSRLASTVTPASLTLFENVSRHRKGLAMSEARDGLCSQCHVRLRPQVYNDVRRNESVIQCESCARILYFLPPPAGAASAPASS